MPVRKWPATPSICPPPCGKNSTKVSAPAAAAPTVPAHAPRVPVHRGAMVLLTIVIHYVCKFVAKKSFVEILSYLVVRYRYHVDDDEELLKELGEILDVEHRDDDTVESYAQRVEDRMGLEKVRARLKAKNKPIELGGANPKK